MQCSSASQERYAATWFWAKKKLRLGETELREIPRRYVRMSWITLAGSTPVSRMSRP